MMLKKKFLLTCLAFASFINLSFSQANYEDYYQKSYIGIGNLKHFEEGYPTLTFDRHYDGRLQDWIIDVTVPGSSPEENKTFEFYWANGSMLPENQLKNKDKFWSLLTYYPKEIRDPKTYTEKEIEIIREYGSSDSRRESRGTPMFFFDAIYDTGSRLSTESHIQKITFLGKKTNVHKAIVEPLKRVEEKILAAEKDSKEIQDFLKSVKSYDSYSWREIRGTGRRSFHGLGLALDMMPRYLAGKHIFWSWTKDRFPDDWMTVSLSSRWTPPLEIIKIFESEGFIWGGKWVIFDNMHFEYHPELILYNEINYNF